MRAPALAVAAAALLAFAAGPPAAALSAAPWPGEHYLPKAAVSPVPRGLLARTNGGSHGAKTYGCTDLPVSSDGRCGKLHGSGYRTSRSLPRTPESNASPAPAAP